MRTYPMKFQSVNRKFHMTSWETSLPMSTSGLISELIYSEHQSDMTQLLLLPLLQQLGTQSRWQLWLTPYKKLSREWLLRTDLPLNKIMQAPHSGTIAAIEIMIKALQTGNYSVVLGWFEKEVSEENRQRLYEAANSGQALGLIIRPEHTALPSAIPLNELRMHSILYH